MEEGVRNYDTTYLMCNTGFCTEYKLHHDLPNVQYRVLHSVLRSSLHRWWENRWWESWFSVSVSVSVSVSWLLSSFW